MRESPDGRGTEGEEAQADSGEKEGRATTSYLWLCLLHPLVYSHPSSGLSALRPVPLTPRPSPVPCSLSGSSFFLCLQLLPQSLAPFLFKLNTYFSLPE